jgi:porin
MASAGTIYRKSRSEAKDFTGCINISGKWYGRRDDNIGIGYAYLNGNNEAGIDYTHVAEVYWRFVLHEYFALTADMQYVADEYITDDGDINGVILGIRGTVEF